MNSFAVYLIISVKYKKLLLTPSECLNLVINKSILKLLSKIDLTTSFESRLDDTSKQNESTIPHRI